MTSTDELMRAQIGAAGHAIREEARDHGHHLDERTSLLLATVALQASAVIQLHDMLADIRRPAAVVQPARTGHLRVVS